MLKKNYFWLFTIRYIMPEISVAILAGGQNTRFDGNLKALMHWRGEPLINHYISLFSKYTNNLMVITNTPERFNLPGIPLIPDTIPGCGPLSGIHTALSQAMHPNVLITACDMPFLSAAMTDRLLQAPLPEHEVIIPHHAEGREPLFSVWPTNIKATLEVWLKSGKSPKIFHFLEAYQLVKKASFDGHEMLFANINTVSEYHNLHDKKNLADETEC
jgi:molybdenum cofactor guanylyltransferase